MDIRVTEDALSMGNLFPQGKAFAIFMAPSPYAQTLQNPLCRVRVPQQEKRWVSACREGPGWRGIHASLSLTSAP